MAEGIKFQLSYPVPAAPTLEYTVGGRSIAFYPGLYMCAAATGSGKTANMIALQKQLELAKQSSTYTYLNEARSELGFIPEGEITRMLSDLDTWPSKLQIADSLTVYFIEIAAKGSKAAAFKGGLIPEYIKTLYEINARVSKGGKTLIATVNSDLFPLEDALEGMIEGRIDFSAVWSMVKRDRTLRTWEEIPLSDDAIAAAKSQLKWDDNKSVSASQSRFSLGQ